MHSRLEVATEDELRYLSRDSPCAHLDTSDHPQLVRYCHCATWQTVSHVWYYQSWQSIISANLYSLLCVLSGYKRVMSDQPKTRPTLETLIEQSKDALHKGQELGSIGDEMSRNSTSLSLEVQIIDAKLRWLINGVMDQLKVCFLGFKLLLFKIMNF